MTLTCRAEAREQEEPCALLLPGLAWDHHREAILQSAPKGQKCYTETGHGPGGRKPMRTLDILLGHHLPAPALGDPPSFLPGSPLWKSVLMGSP